jgi:hypothetical protein
MNDGTNDSQSQIDADAQAPSENTPSPAKDGSKQKKKTARFNRSVPTVMSKGKPKVSERMVIVKIPNAHAKYIESKVKELNEVFGEERITPELLMDKILENVDMVNAYETYVDEFRPEMDWAKYKEDGSDQWFSVFCRKYLDSDSTLSLRGVLLPGTELEGSRLSLYAKPQGDRGLSKLRTRYVVSPIHLPYWVEPDVDLLNRCQVKIPDGNLALPEINCLTRFCKEIEDTTITDERLNEWAEMYSEIPSIKRFWAIPEITRLSVLRTIGDDIIERGYIFSFPEMNEEVSVLWNSFRPESPARVKVMSDLSRDLADWPEELRSFRHKLRLNALCYLDSIISKAVVRYDADPALGGVSKMKLKVPDRVVSNIHIYSLMESVYFGRIHTLSFPDNLGQDEFVLFEEIATELPLIELIESWMWPFQSGKDSLSDWELNHHRNLTAEDFSMLEGSVRLHLFPENYILTRETLPEYFGSLIDFDTMDELGLNPEFLAMMGLCPFGNSEFIRYLNDHEGTLEWEAKLASFGQIKTKMIRKFLLRTIARYHLRLPQ